MLQRRLQCALFAVVWVHGFCWSQHGPVSVRISPTNGFLQVGQCAKLSATVAFFTNVSGGYQAGQSAHWLSTDPLTAKIATCPGAFEGVQGVKTGHVTILAKVGPFVGTTTMTIIPAATQNGLTISPASISVHKGLTQQFTVTATFNDGSSVDVSDAATWATNNPAAAIITAQGEVKAIASSGSAVISSSFPPTTPNFTAAATLTDLPPIPQSLTMVPANPSVALGLKQQFNAIVTFTDLSFQDQTTSSSLTSSNTSVATINSAGLATTLATGPTTITGTFTPVSSSPVTGSTILTVTPPALVSIALGPSSPSVQAGKALALTATGSYTNGSKNITNMVNWTSSNTTLASVNVSGVVTGVKPGTVTITATLGSVSQSTNVNVLSTLAITTSSLANGNAGLVYGQTLAATGGLAPYVWSLASGSFPGVSLNTVGVLSGTPTAGGTYTLTAKVTDSESPTQSVTKSLTVFVGNSYFVDSVAGNDLNTGLSSAQAWQTLLKVTLGTYQPGDAILLKAGDVWNQSSQFTAPTTALQILSAGTASRPITLSSYGSGAQPIIDGVNSSAVFGVVVNTSADVQVKNLTMQNFTGYGVDVKNSPNGLVENCTFKNIANSAVNVSDGSPNVVVDHNIFTDDVGVTSISFVRFATTTSDNPVISNNTVGDIGAHFGIAIVDGNNAKIFGNNVTGNGHDITIESATRNVTSGQIYDNVTTNCSNLEGDGECISLTGTNGFTVTASIYRNFVKGGSQTVNGIAGFHAVNSKIYDNVVINAPLGSDFDFTNSSKNNVFYNNSSYSALNNGFAFTGGSTGNVVKNNIVKLVGQDGVYADAGSVPVTEDYDILNQFGFLIVSSNMVHGSHTISSDPQFVVSVPATANDFKLKAGSPAIDSGVNLGASYNQGLDPDGTGVPYPTLDENQFGSGWERGAFVFRP